MQMIRARALFCALLGVLLTVGVQAQQDGVAYEWTRKLNKEGIEVFTSPVPDSKFKAVRAQMLVKSGMHQLIGLVADSSACPRWADLCKEERVLETVSPTESYVYTYNDIPFPVSDRDVVAQVLWSRDATADKVTMSSSAVTDKLPKTKAVRIEDAFAQWHFTAQDDGQVLVENFAHIDPNGPTPAWITNMLLTESPYKTLKAMRALVEAGEYADYVPWFQQDAVAAE